jgi:hypothetical protein
MTSCVIDSLGGRLLPNPRLQRPGVFGRYWLVSCTGVMQVLCGWRVKARR